jgi:hypothetical protein
VPPHDAPLSRSQWCGTIFAVTAVISRGTLFVANVGDSRAIVGQDKGGKLIAYPLSSDQTCTTTTTTTATRTLSPSHPHPQPYPHTLSSDRTCVAAVPTHPLKRPDVRRTARRPAHRGAPRHSARRSGLQTTAVARCAVHHQPTATNQRPWRHTAPEHRHPPAAHAQGPLPATHRPHACPT